MKAKEKVAMRKRMKRFLGRPDHGPYVESCIMQFAEREIDRERRRARDTNGARKP